MSLSSLVSSLLVVYLHFILVLVIRSLTSDSDSLLSSVVVALLVSRSNLVALLV